MAQEKREDARNRLAEGIFSYRSFKDGRVAISWHGKQVTILKGKAAQSFLSKIADCDDYQAQLLMAKATGNFKHGNERDPKRP